MVYYKIPEFIPYNCIKMQNMRILIISLLIVFASSCKKSKKSNSIVNSTKAITQIPITNYSLYAQANYTGVCNNSVDTLLIKINGVTRINQTGGELMNGEGMELRCKTGDHLEIRQTIGVDHYSNNPIQSNVNLYFTDSAFVNSYTVAVQACTCVVKYDGYVK